MIKNKDEIRIYTIDGFTNQIFKNTIAPFFGIYGYETLDEEDDGFYEDILVKILNNNEYFEKFSFVFEEKKERKDIKKYVKFIFFKSNLIQKIVNSVFYFGSGFFRKSHYDNIFVTYSFYKICYIFEGQSVSFSCSCTCFQYFFTHHPIPPLFWQYRCKLLKCMFLFFLPNHSNRSYNNFL